MTNGFLKPYICTQCGGAVNRATLRCEMCGTEFKETDNGIYVRIEQPHAHTLKCTTHVSKDEIYVMGLQEASEYALKRIAEELGHGLYPFMEVTSEDRFEMNAQAITAKIRVLDRDYRF